MRRRTRSAAHAHDSAYSERTAALARRLALTLIDAAEGACSLSRTVQGRFGGAHRASQHAESLARWLEDARDRSADLERALEFDYEISTAIMHELSYAVHESTAGEDLVRQVDQMLSVLYRLTKDASTHCADAAVHLADMQQTDAKENGTSGHLPVSRSAQRLTTLASACLPRSHRARYREEFEAELYDLARISRPAQWRYALMISLTAWRLRQAVCRAAGAPVRQGRSE